MPRDLAGNYTLPAGNPVVNNTLIESAWANSTLSDIATAINGVPTRDGKLGFTGPVTFGGVATETATHIRFGYANAGIFGYAKSVMMSYDGMNVFSTTADGIKVNNVFANELNLGFGTSSINTTILSGPQSLTDSTTAIETYTFSMDTVPVYSIAYNAGVPVITIPGKLVVGAGTFAVNLVGNTFSTRNGFSFSQTVGVDTVTWLSISSVNVPNFPYKLQYQGYEVGWKNALVGSTNGGTPPISADIGKTLYISYNMTLNGVFNANDQFYILNASPSSVNITPGAGVTIKDGATGATVNPYVLTGYKRVTVIWLTVNLVIFN